MGVVEITDLSEKFRQMIGITYFSSEENTEEISKLNSKLDKISAAIDYLSKI